MDVFIFKSVPQQPQHELLHQPVLMAKKLEMTPSHNAPVDDMTLHVVRSTPRRFQQDVERTADALRKVAAEAKIHIAPWLSHDIQICTTDQVRNFLRLSP